MVKVDIDRAGHRFTATLAAAPRVGDEFELIDDRGYTQRVYVTLISHTLPISDSTDWGACRQTGDSSITAFVSPIVPR